MSVYNILIHVYLSIVATVRLNAGKYNTSEPAGRVEVCADLINATLGSGQSLRINFAFNDGSALRNRKSWSIKCHCLLRCSFM